MDVIFSEGVNWNLWHLSAVTPGVNQTAQDILIRAHLQKLLWSHVLKLLLSTAWTHQASKKVAAHSETTLLHILFACIVLPLSLAMSRCGTRCKRGRAGRSLWSRDNCYHSRALAMTSFKLFEPLIVDPGVAVAR